MWLVNLHGSGDTESEHIACFLAYIIRRVKVLIKTITPLWTYKNDIIQWEGPLRFYLINALVNGIIPIYLPMSLRETSDPWFICVSSLYQSIRELYRYNQTD